MQICLIADRPNHPVLSAAMGILARRHDTRMALAEGLAADPMRRSELDQPADIYLLKSRSPAALEFGTLLTDRGATVINRPQATAMCIDRAAMADRLRQAGLPQPRTAAFPKLADVPAAAHDLRFPLMVKSRHSRRGDLVTKLEEPADVGPLMHEWANEPVVVQEFRRGDGYDLKLWAIGTHMHAARRRTPLETGAIGAAKKNLPLDEELTRELGDLGRAVGRAFSLHLYGIDVIMSADGPSIIDVNAFPGFRGVEGAPELLAALVELSATAARNA